jgi:hypothetical protein
MECTPSRPTTTGSIGTGTSQDQLHRPLIGYLLSFGIAWARRRLGCGAWSDALFIGCQSCAASVALSWRAFRLGAVASRGSRSVCVRSKLGIFRPRRVTKIRWRPPSHQTGPSVNLGQPITEMPAPSRTRGSPDEAIEAVLPAERYAGARLSAAERASTRAPIASSAPTARHRICSLLRSPTTSASKRWPV